MEKLIRITAVCSLFSIVEEVKEKKAVARLAQIKKMYLDYQQSKGAGNLKVTTAVVNPQLF